MSDARNAQRSPLRWGIAVATGLTLVALGCKGGGDSTGPEAIGCATSEAGLVERWTLAATAIATDPAVTGFIAHPTNSNLTTQWSPSIRVVALGLQGDIGDDPAEVGMNMSISTPSAAEGDECVAGIRSAELVLVKNPAGGPGIVPEVHVYQLTDGNVSGDCPEVRISSVSDDHIAVTEMCAEMREVFINGDPDGPAWIMQGSFTAFDG